uniref:Apolipoprotein M n=1 Tax=Esox lucius TaxID=8010 RepID=A0A3P8ZYK9_ESOLU
MPAVCLTVFLGLLSLGGSQAAPLTCEEILKPLELSSLNQVPSLLRYTDCLAGCLAWIHASVDTQEKTIDVKLFYNGTLGGKDTMCISISYNYTQHDNKTWSSVFLNPSSMVLLTTCPDCFLTLERWHENGKPYRSLKLLSRRRELTAAELDFYKKQVDCLNLPTAVFMDPQTDLCPLTSTTAEEVVESLVTRLMQLLSQAFVG